MLRVGKTGGLEPSAGYVWQGGEPFYLKNAFRADG
jgi:hypothetical protein